MARVDVNVVNNGRANPQGGGRDDIQRQISGLEAERDQLRERFHTREQELINTRASLDRNYRNSGIDESTYNAASQINSKQINDLVDSYNSDFAENQRKTNELLEKLVGLQESSEKGDTISDQRNNEEHGQKGLLQELFEKRAGLQTSKLAARSKDEIREIDKELSSVTKEIQNLSGNNRTSDVLTRGGNIMGSVMSGNLSGAASSIAGLISNPYVLAAVATVGGVVAGMKTYEGRKENVNQLAAMRGQGTRREIEDQFSDSGFASYMDQDQYTQYRKSLSRASGLAISGNNDRALNAFRVESGLGIDSVSSVSQYERQDKYGKSTSDNILAMLNVLGEIRDGSISPNDLTLANEKVALMNRLQGNQFGSQTNFDQRQVLGLMSAFEKMGGEGKDQRAGDFISGTMNALKDGGHENIRLLKYQFAAKANPGIANDPASLARMVEQGTDPAYLASTLKGLKGLSGGNKQNEYFLFKEFFGSLTPDMRDKLISAGGNSDILNDLTKGITGSSSGQVTSQQDITTRADDNILLTDEITRDFKKSVADFTVAVARFLNGSYAPAKNVDPSKVK